MVFNFAKCTVLSIFYIMFESFDIWKLLAGLGIFMFGMFLMEESIKKLSGRAFKRLIREYTSGKVKSILSGIFTTAILQSSSAVSLMVLAFVGARIMTMDNAIGVILGSNIGTTITGWIVATLGFQVQIESFALPLIGIGGLGLIFLGQSEKYSAVSKLLAGFGFLFMGIDYMKGSVETFAQGFDMSTIPDYGLMVYVGIGVLLTAVMQSSSATMAIVLTALNAGIIGFSASAAMVIGANLGTTITVLLGAIGAAPAKKRVAFSHFAFNLITGIVALVAMPLLVFISLSVFASNNHVVALALFHTIFNVLGVLVFYPLIKYFSVLLTKVFPDKLETLTLHINNVTPNVAEAAIPALRMESIHLVQETLRYNLAVLDIDEKLVFTSSDLAGKKIRAGITLETQYNNLKLLQAELFTFSASIQTHELTEEDSVELNRYLHGARMTLHAAKSLKDVRHDFEEFANSDNDFLNDQYMNFRKRLIETYLKIDKLMDEREGADKVKRLLLILKHIKEDDHTFVAFTTKAISANQISDINVSTALIVNRAFVQSSRQLLLSLRELLLNSDEIKQFMAVQEINETLLEYE